MTGEGRGGRDAEGGDAGKGGSDLGVACVGQGISLYSCWAGTGGWLYRLNFVVLQYSRVPPVSAALCFVGLEPCQVHHALLA